MLSLKEIRDRINQTEIRPRAIFAYSTRNARTGAESGEKSAELSFSVTLWHLILGVVIAVAAIQVVSSLRDALLKRDARKKLLQKMEEKGKTAGK